MSSRASAEFMRWLVVVSNTLPLAANLIFAPDWTGAGLGVVQMIFGLWVFNYLGNINRQRMVNQAIYKLRGGK